MPLVIGKWTARSSTVTSVSPFAPRARRRVAQDVGDRRSSCRHLRRIARSMSLSRWKQALRRPCRCRRAAGTLCQHSSVAIQQRGAKEQPGGRWLRSGRQPLDRLQRVGARPVESRHAAQQADRVGVVRVMEERLRRPLLDDASRVHDEDPPAHAGDDAEVVGDDDHGGVVLAARAASSDAGSAPGWSRRAPSWARRRAAAWGCRRAPWRSSRAGACRRENWCG